MQPSDLRWQRQWSEKQEWGTVALDRNLIKWGRTCWAVFVAGKWHPDQLRCAERWTRSWWRLSLPLVYGVYSCSLVPHLAAIATFTTLLGLHAPILYLCCLSSVVLQWQELTIIWLLKQLFFLSWLVSVCSMCTLYDQW